jgi:hypothetical protein
MAILRRVIDLIQVSANGAELGPVLQTIEDAGLTQPRRSRQGECGRRGGIRRRPLPAALVLYALSRPARFNDGLTMWLL